MVIIFITVTEVGRKREQGTIPGTLVFVCYIFSEIVAQSNNSFQKQLYAFLGARTPRDRSLESLVAVFIYVAVSEVGRKRNGTGT